MRKFLSVFVLFLSPALLYARQPSAVLPINYVDGLIFIELRLNEYDKPLHFMFDTGAGVTVIDTQVAFDIDLVVSDTLKIGTSSKSILTPFSYKNRIVIHDDVVLDGIEIGIMDLEHLSEYLKINVDGIIGLDLMKNFIVETNADNKELRIYQPLNSSEIPMGVPFEIHGLESNHFGIPLTIQLNKNAEPIEMLFKIDTGAPNYLTFHNATVEKFDLVNASRKVKSRQGFGVDSTIVNNLRGKLYQAFLCSKNFKNITIVLEIDPLNRMVERPADGLVGQAILNRFNITYNIKEGIVYLNPRK